MKIALVRGPNLSQYEMQTFEPLADAHEVVAFGSRQPLHEADDVRIPVKQLGSPDDVVESLPKPLSLPTRGLLSRTGRNKWLVGLEDALAGFDIAHTMGITHGYTYQAIRAKREHPELRVVVTVWQNIPFHRPTIAGVEGGNDKARQAVLDEADLFIASTERARDALRLEGVEAERIRVQHTGVDTERFAPRDPDPALAERFGTTDAEHVILFVGRLEWYKGPYETLRGLRLLLEDRDLDRTGVRLLLRGEGPERDGLEEEIDRLDLSEVVQFVPRVSYDELPRLYNLADAFVAPSIPIRQWQEQLGFVLLEAMASGVPVVTAASGSIPEVVGDAAELVNPADPRSLSEALGRVLPDPKHAKRLSMEGRQRALDTFDGARVAEAFERLYREALDR